MLIFNQYNRSPSNTCREVVVLIKHGYHIMYELKTNYNFHLKFAPNTNDKELITLDLCK